MERQTNDNDGYKPMKLKKLHTNKLRYRQHLVDITNNQSILDSNRCNDATDYVADSIPMIDSQASIDLTMTQPLSPVYRPKKGRLVACNPDMIEEEIEEEGDNIDNDITLSNIRDIDDESVTQTKTNSFSVVLDADNDITLSNIKDFNDESITQNKTNASSVVLDADIRGINENNHDELRCITGGSLQ